MLEPGKFRFQLVSPEKMVMTGEVEQVVVPGAEGDFTVLPNHAPVLASLRPGILDITIAKGEERRIFVRGGFAQVTPESLTVLAQRTINVEDLDFGRLEEEIRDAEDDLQDAGDDETRRKAQDTLDRLKVIQQVIKAEGISR